MITDRDEKLFKYLFAHKGAPIEQIHRDIFYNASKRRVYKRIQKLRDYKLINIQPYYSKNIIKGCFTVSKFGLEQVYDLDDIANKELKSANLEHDFTLTDLKHVLTKAHCFDFYATENEMQARIADSEDHPVEACGELNSDALLGIKWEGHHYHFAIEYENSEKTIKRYVDLFKNYYGYPIISNIIYFTKNEKIRKRIINADKKVMEWRADEASKIYTINMEDLKKPFKKMRVLNSSGQYIELNWSKEICL